MKTPQYTTMLSNRSVEAAMIAKIFKNSLIQEESYKGVKIHGITWERDNGEVINLKLRVHPSFPNEKVCIRRIEERIELLLSGGKPGVDQNAVLRLEGVANKGGREEKVVLDLSMESFDRSVLADDGMLTIGWGVGNAKVKEPMKLKGSTRIKWMDEKGGVIPRKRCLEEIQTTLQEKRQEKMILARQLARQEDLVVSQQKQNLKEQEEISVDDKSFNAIDAVEGVNGNFEHSSMFEKEPKEFKKEYVAKEAEVTMVTPDQGRDWVDSSEERVKSKKIESETLNSDEDENGRTIEKGRLKDVQEENQRDENQEYGLREAGFRPLRPLTVEEVHHLFPNLKEGWDEVLLGMNADQWIMLSEELTSWGEFELRIIARNQEVWSVGISTPREHFKKAMALSAKFTQGGVMIRRATRT